jgi:hypothetical protein
VGAWKISNVLRNFFESCKNLAHLELSSNELDDSNTNDVLTSNLISTLVSLDIKYNSVGDQICERIAQFISHVSKD